MVLSNFALSIIPGFYFTNFCFVACQLYLCLFSLFRFLCWTYGSEVLELEKGGIKNDWKRGKNLVLRLAEVFYCQRRNRRLERNSDPVCE